MSSLCACCLSETTVDSQNFQDFVSVLHVCFNIKVRSSCKRGIICSPCVKKLNDLEQFRAQIKSAQKFIKQKHNGESDENYNAGKAEFSVPATAENVVPTTTDISTEQNGCGLLSDQSQNVPELSHAGKVKVKSKAKESLPYKLDRNSRTCPLCRQHFIFFKDLTNHMPTHFPDHICETCGKLCATKLSLQNHIKTHRLHKHACDICGKKYKKKSTLKDHIKTVHNNEKKVYKCVECTEEFHSSHARLLHSISVHGHEDKKYKCSHCSNGYNHSSHLRAHVRSQHNHETHVKCDLCTSSFSSMSASRKHMVKHRAEKLFECALCSKKFPRKSALKQHMKIHLNQKAFVCAVCGRAFTQKITMKKHALTHKADKSQHVVNNLTSMLQKL